MLGSVYMKALRSSILKRGSLYSALLCFTLLYSALLCLLMLTGARLGVHEGLEVLYLEEVLATLLYEAFRA